MSIPYFHDKESKCIVTCDIHFEENELFQVDTDAADENGYSVNTGVRSMVTQEVELMGEVGYYDVDDGDVTMKVGANYYFAPSWAAGVSYKKIGDIDMTQITARYTF